MTQTLTDVGHVVAPGFVARQLATTLYATLLLRRARGEFQRDGQVPNALSFWGDSTLDGLLVALRPDVERLAGGPLLPTYCYGRLYLHGDRLDSHRDREGCEVVVSIHLGHSGAEPPPLRLEGDVAVRQAPGDGVVFLGQQVSHWRDAFEGDDFGQVFLNYVWAAGRQAHLRYDGRWASFPSAGSHPELFPPPPLDETPTGG